MKKSILWVLYLICIACITWQMFRARETALKVYGTESAQASWDQWRDDAAKASGPVDRDPPASPNPPAFVLMRDYFVPCLALALVLSSVLFATFAVMLDGALARNSRPIR